MAKVLIVDDSLRRSCRLAAAMSEWGHHVRFACDRASAVSAAADFRPDAVLVGSVPGGCPAGVLRAAPGLARALLVALEGEGGPPHAGFDLLLRDLVCQPSLRRALERLGP